MAGSPNRLVRTAETQELEAKQIICHPEYAAFLSSIMVNDIAIILLKREILLNDFAQVLPIADSKPLPGLPCTILGWGRILTVSKKVHICTWDNTTKQLLLTLL